MSNELLVALISLSGVLVSVFVSVLISLRATNTELQKLRTEIQQTYTNKVLEKRIETYPALYCLLSDFAKKSWLKTFSQNEINSLYHDTNKWHSKNSILFSAQTNVVSYRFFGVLRKLKNKEWSSDNLHEFVNGSLAEFELALKSDIGIYIVEFSDPEKRFHTHTDIASAITKQTNAVNE
ncbi:hypothetical protein DRJ25_06475 [Candidatus Woesearchaeota archaeon]|nr:MAG: hypothetical protein DRJ25_06475 [Candidatus Woesearchaeota archaeon]